MRRMTLAALAALGALVLVHAPAARAQDRDDYRPRRTVPASVSRELVDIYNAERTRRLRGSSTIEEDEDIRGDVAVLDGTLTVRGLVRGRVVAINGDVRPVRGARVEGDILIGGGSLTGRGEGWVGGEVRTYADRVAYRRDGVMLVADERRDRDLAWWTDFKSTKGGFQSDINFGGASTYNRVEGLPINLGPQIRTDFSGGRFLLDAQAVFRTIQGWQWNPQTVGHKVRTELRLGTRSGIAFGACAYDIVDGVETWQMSDAEVGLASALFQRDFRDYYLRHGGQAYVRMFAGDGGEVTVGYAHEQWKNAQLTNVYSLFKLGGGWRPLPTMDEGDMHLLTARWQLDTRNDIDDPTNGWWIQADYERGEGMLRRIGALPFAQQAAVPFTGTTYQRGFVDFRRYTRVGPDAQLNFRVVGGGLLPNSDPLPMQRKLSVSGPGSLGGFAFREENPGEVNISECTVTPLPGTPANCDRMLLAQLEFKGSLNFNLFNDVFDRYDAAGERGYKPAARRRGSSSSRSGHWVLFADAGRGWLAGSSPVPGLAYAGKIPEFSTFRTDIGAGFDFGPLGLYYAKAMSDQARPGVFFLRLHSRF
ncbi:MAG: BamA/TamA family outer membrane protein [Gemmatimonadetes bacterium]|nr:BamA/TamA family outer membrane protein [Gemmatimonadota bacterium]